MAPFFPRCFALSLALWIVLHSEALAAPSGRIYKIGTRVIASIVACGIPLATIADSSGSNYIQQGMKMFTQGKIAESIKLYDEAEKIDKRYSKYLWLLSSNLSFSNCLLNHSLKFLGNEELAIITTMNLIKPNCSLRSMPRYHLKTRKRDSGHICAIQNSFLVMKKIQSWKDRYPIEEIT